MRGCIGVALLLLGASAMDTELDMIWCPIVIMVIGGIFMIWEKRASEKNKVNDYTHNRNSRHYDQY